MALATHFVGRVSELDSVDGLLTNSERADLRRSSSSASPESVRRACSPSWPPAQTRADTSSSRAGRRELELDLPFWVFVDALDEYVHGLDPHRARAASTRRTGGSSRPSSRHSPTSQEKAATSIQHERYRSHRAVVHAARAARAGPAAGARARRRPLGRSGVDRAAWRPAPPTARRARPDRARGAPAADERATQRRARTRAPRRHDHAHRARGAEPGGGARALGDGSWRDATCTRTRRQPLLPGAARSVCATAAPRAAPDAEEPSLAGVDVPAAVAAALAEELALLSEAGTRHPRRRRGRRRSRSTPNWRQPPREPPRRQRSTRSTSCFAWTSSARRTFRGAFGSGIRSSAARSTSRRQAAGGSAHTSAAPAPSRSGDRRPRRSPTIVERSARQGDEAAIALLREAGEAASARAPASAARWFGAALRLLRRMRRATAASSCCWPVPKRSPPPASSATATQPCSRA